MVGVRCRAFPHFSNVDESERGEVRALVAVVPVRRPVDAGAIFVAENKAELGGATAPVLVFGRGKGDVIVMNKKRHDLDTKDTEVYAGKKAASPTTYLDNRDAITKYRD